MNHQYKSHFKKGLKMLLVIVSTLVGLLACIFLFLLLKSPGKPDPFMDKRGKPLAGSISERVFIPVGGVKQGMIIRSKNPGNPVLLYLHGGPAFPNYFLIDKYKPGLEDFFTVCYWEQRGGGLSYTPEVDIASMNFSQLTSDAIEVTQYLRKRFKQEKIYIMAHSGGTPIALKAVQRSPDLYQAYIAMAQITDQKESEKIACQYMIEQYEKKGRKRAVEVLKNYRIADSDQNIVSFYKSAHRDKFMHQLGIGTMHQMNSVFWDIFVPVWTCKAYTISEKINIWKSKFTFLPKTGLINEMFAADLTSQIKKVEVPVYFLSGKHDLTVNIDLSRAYFDKLEAPLKGFYTFHKSAHSPLFEEPMLVMQVIERDVLHHSNHLSCFQRWDTLKISLDNLV